MKSIIAIALFIIMGAAGLFALVAVAQAKPAPVEPWLAAFRPADLAIATGASGATLEQDYFHAPPPFGATGHVFPCRLQLIIFDKTRLAQACR